MKILVYSDVHGNYSSLMQLIKEPDYQDSDIKISLGDTIVDYSRPNECIEFIEENALAIIGNNDVFVCDHIPKQGLINFSTRKQTQIKFMSRLVTNENKIIVSSWMKELAITIGSHKLYFTHYNWISDDDVDEEPRIKSFFTRDYMFGGIDAEYVFFGHEHKANHFSENGKHYYCVGSLGLEYDAYYLTIEIDDSDNISIKDHYFKHDLDYEDKLEIELKEKYKDLYHI